MTVDLQKAREVFLHVVGNLSPEQWDRFVDETCAADAELNLQVKQLLQVHREAGSFLSRPAAAVGLTAAFDSAGRVEVAAGTVIGAYKLLQQIGEGGMGTVFMAEQLQPVQRKVALKVIKPGMDSAQVIARFEAERQALALMDHVNIARVLDAGTTDNRRPYFVMELVHGVPITKYCDDNHLTPRQRLELFVPVCQAIQHAHQKGIIHRDIKPSNVMVTLYDGKPVPKVIDFGVAKATEQRLTERTLFTQYGTMVGTLEYMSPEQAEMSALGVDTRSDIYSLGVLLYELLTGSTPLNRQKIREAAYDEILRMIKEDDPPKPSTRLSDSGEALASISAQRHTEPAKLTKLVRGELDWIVMKTLEKDRNRRYESATAFAADIQRYLADEAVQACPPSVIYRFSKFARRNKVALLTSSVVAVSLLLGTAISVWQAVRALNAQRVAMEQRDAAKESEADTKAFGDFMVEDVLAMARPKGQQGGLGIAVTIRQGIDAAVPKIAATFAGRPRAEAKTRGALGLTYLFLGDAAAAIAQLEPAAELYRVHLGADHPETLGTNVHLGMAYQAAERFDKAILLLEETIRKQKVALGTDNIATLAAMSSLAATYRETGRPRESVQLFEVTLALQKSKLGADHENTLSTMSSLAAGYHFAGRLNEAIAIHEDAVRLQKAKLGGDHPHTLAFMGNLAGAYGSAGRLDEAIRVYEESIALMKKSVGPDHPYTLGTMGNLGSTYRSAGLLTEAMTLLEETLKLQKTKLGPDHSYTVSTMNNLAVTYQEFGRLKEAESLFEDVLKLQKTLLAKDHPSTLATMSNLAGSYLAAGRANEALPLLEGTLALQRSQLGPDTPGTLLTMCRLARAYHGAGRITPAITLLEETVKLRQSKLGPEHPHTMESMADLGRMMVGDGKQVEAEPLLRATLNIYERKWPTDFRTYHCKSLLGGSLLAQKQFADAEPLLLAGYEGITTQLAKIPFEERAKVAEALDRIVRFYEATENKEKAAVWRQKREAKPAVEKPKGPNVN